MFQVFRRSTVVYASIASIITRNVTFASPTTFQTLRQALVIPVKGGKEVPNVSMKAEELWEDNEVTVIYVLRRPGWVLCREEGSDLHALKKSGALGNAVMIGIIKEVAPVKFAPTDAKLGVDEFNTVYFPYPLYRDVDLAFYKALGKRNIIHDFPSWNPFTIYKQYKALTARANKKKIYGNLLGEGMVAGGVLVISKDKGVTYVYREVINHPVPVDEIKEAVRLCFEKH